MMPTITAIVPMRHESERVLGKNYRDFAGEPLYRRIVSTLLSCSEIDTVMIDTDSELILEDAGKVFPTVKLYKRPKSLSDGMTNMNDVLLNSISQVDSDIYLQSHSTNPLLTRSSISQAIKIFLTSRGVSDSLFSVTRLQTRLWNNKAQPFNHDSTVLLRTQDLEPLFEENSCLYLFSKSSLTKYKNRIGANPIMMEIDKVQAIDIDDEQDFLVAEALYKQLGAKELTE